MKNLMIYVSIIFGTSLTLFSQGPQTLECVMFSVEDVSQEEFYTEPPWFENRNLLDNYDPSDLTAGTLSSRSPNCGESDVVFHIPLFITAYLRVDETLEDAFSFAELQAALDYTNSSFQESGLNVRFSIADCIGQVFDNDAVVMSPVENWWRTLDGSENQQNLINIYVVDDIDRDGGPSGVSMGPQNGDIMLERQVFSTFTRRTTFAHELGHSFGLAHTHRNSDKGDCKQEPVSRARGFDDCFWRTGTMCHKTADGFCDTEADPNLNATTVDGVNCVYVGNQTDRWGDLYSPNVTNIMATGNRQCRRTFSYGQSRAISYGMATIRDNSYHILNSQDNFVGPDVYEPDNTNLVMRSSRYIEIGETQVHTFHDIPVEGGSCDDPEDWIAIASSDGHIGTYEFKIDTPCDENPIEEVEVWLVDNIGNLTTRSSAASVSNLPFILTIPCTLSEEELRIRIVSKTNLEENRTYTVDLSNTLQDFEIVGPGNACDNSQYFVGDAGVPLNNQYSVSWSIIGGTITTDGNRVIVTGVQPNQDAILSASVTTPHGCNRSFNQILSAPDYNVPNISIDTRVIGVGCEAGIEAFVTGTPPGAAYTYEWDCRPTNQIATFTSNCSSRLGLM